jgi:hypothetical protein
VGAAVAAATYGVQLVAAVPVSTTGDNVGLGVGWYASLTLAGLGGLTLAVRGYLRQGRTAAVAAGSAIDASRPRDTIAGMLAAGERVEHEVAGCGVVVDEGGGQIGRHAASGRSFGPTTGADYVVVNAKNHCGVGCQCTSFRYTNIDDHLC